MNACTIVAKNYLPYARVLAESFLEHHPDGTFTTMVIEPLDGLDASNEPFELVGPYDIGIDRREYHRMALIYDVKELATAMKPWLLKRLLQRGEVAYFDPDIQVFDSLDDVAKHAEQHAIVLTPHTTRELPRDGRLPDEKMILRAGVFNLGFIAVGAPAAAFLDWWSERLARDCLDAVEQGLFVDQRWVDLVPALFDHYVLRDEGCNVAYWNLHHRQVERRGGRYLVGGVPLRFFHFSGFRPEAQDTLSIHMGGAPLILLDERPEVAQLCRDYSKRLLEAGYSAGRDRDYAYDRLPQGMLLDRRLRRIARAAILTAERTHDQEPPDPFDPLESGAFIAWLKESMSGGDVSRYLQAFHDDRTDLQAAFPDLDGADRDRYLAWARSSGRYREQIPEEFLPGLGDLRTGRLKARARAVAARAEAVVRSLPVDSDGRLCAQQEAAASDDARGSDVLREGVNVVGYFRAEVGLGEAARRLVAALDNAQIPHTTITHARTYSRQRHPFSSREPRRAPFDVNLVCVNADEMPRLQEEIGPDFFAGRYTIGLWFWEVARFPETFSRALDIVDEVWTASDFVREAIAAATPKPVHVVPLPIEVPVSPPRTRTELGLPDNFLFYFNFDFMSVFERKNPLGLLEAFTRAFGPDEGPFLLIKSVNGDRFPDQLARLRQWASDRPDVRVVDGYLSAADRDALAASCDCYVSLHRSEGFGLTIAEAMALGRPVIATGYSGNLTLMNEANSYLVPFRLTPIPEGCDPYPAGAEWADPDLDRAAELMREVYEHQDVASERGKQGREDVLRRHDIERAAGFVTTRLNEVRAFRRARGNGLSPRTTEVRLPQTSLERALQHVAREPARSLAAKGGPVGIARRLLRRLLWPYVAEQHELNLAVTQALRDIAESDTTMLSPGGELRKAHVREDDES